MYIYEYDSPIGTMIMASDGFALISLSWQKYGAIKNDFMVKKLPVFEKTIAWLNAYFSREKLPETPAIELCGTEFQKTVWEILLDIPSGQRTTYGEIAEKVAKLRRMEKMSAQAVGRAIGSNPIALIVPCHRVLGKDNSLTGYAGGIERKEFLLKLEQGV